MTNKQIVKKAIEKAIKNGYANHLDKARKALFIFEVMDKLSAFDIIFSHDFAKAFFGEEEWWEESHDNGKTWEETCFEPVACRCMGHLSKYHHNWKYHLSEMSLEEEPLKYIEKFIN